MVEVIDWKDNDDGSADVTFNINKEEEVVFTKIGMLHCIKEGIKATEGDLNEHKSDEGRR